MDKMPEVRKNSPVVVGKVDFSYKVAQDLVFGIYSVKNERWIQTLYDWMKNNKGSWYLFDSKTWLQNNEGRKLSLINLAGSCRIFSSSVEAEACEYSIYDINGNVVLITDGLRYFVRPEFILVTQAKKV